MRVRAICLVVPAGITGGLPGLPYRVLRPESQYPRTKDDPRPPRPIVLQELRPY